MFDRRHPYQVGLIIFHHLQLNWSCNNRSIRVIAVGVDVKIWFRNKGVRN